MAMVKKKTSHSNWKHSCWNRPIGIKPLGSYLSDSMPQYAEPFNHLCLLSIRTSSASALHFKPCRTCRRHYNVCNKPVESAATGGWLVCPPQEQHLLALIYPQKWFIYKCIQIYAATAYSTSSSHPSASHSSDYHHRVINHLLTLSSSCC